MKERKYNKTKMKQIVDSHWKLFNKQTNLIASGNVIANTQYSNVIRPWKETECNGRTNPFGRLMEFDLQGFKKHAIPDQQQVHHPRDHLPVRKKFRQACLCGQGSDVVHLRLARRGS